MHVSLRRDGEERIAVSGRGQRYPGLRRSVSFYTAVLRGFDISRRNTVILEIYVTVELPCSKLIKHVHVRGVVSSRLYVTRV